MDRAKVMETLGGVFILLGCLGVVAFFFTVWLPWMWVYHVENAKWLQAHGDLSRLTRWTLQLDRWLRCRLTR